MSALTTDRVLALLSHYVDTTGLRVDLVLIGGLALQAYGHQDRATQDLDGELIGDLAPLIEFLSTHHIPADLGADISGWSVVAMPPGYRERTTILIDRPNLRVRLLAPVDFVIAKLRRGTELDLDDAAFVVTRFHVPVRDIRAAARAAVAASPQDTALFIFLKIVDIFCKRLGEPSSD